MIKEDEVKELRNGTNGTAPKAKAQSKLAL